MYDATVVSLCREYLETWDASLLPLLADRLEELGWDGGDVGLEKNGAFYFSNLRLLREYLGFDGQRNVVVPGILKLYGG